MMTLQETPCTTDTTLSLLLEVCCRSAGMMIENGGETYRAEESVSFLCAHFGAKVGVAVLSTTLFVQIELDGQTVQAVRRLDKRTLNLDCLAQVNEIVRNICAGSITLDEAQEKLKNVRKNGPYHSLIHVICFCVAAAAAVFVYGGGWYDLLPAFLCGLVYPCMPDRWKDRVASQMIVYCASGAVIALVAMLSYLISPLVNPVAIVAASAISLYPGAAFVNAIRDTMHGDLVSGVARLCEALLKVGMLAAGAAVVFGLWTNGLVGQPVQFISLPWIGHFIAGFFVVICLAIEQCTPPKTIIVCGIIGAFSYIVCKFMVGCVPFMPAAYFVGALVMSVSCEWMARKMKLPATVFLVSAIMVLVPGKGLFDSMLYLASGMYSLLAKSGADTLVQMIAMSMAIALSTFCSRSISAKK